VRPGQRKTEPSTAPQVAAAAPARKSLAARPPAPVRETKAAPPAPAPSQAAPALPPAKQTQTAAVQAPPPPKPTAPTPAAIVPMPKSAFETFRDCDVCPQMVKLPAGNLTMGQSRGDATEMPAHRVAIGRPFGLGSHEVTYGEWKACVTGGGCEHLPKLKGATDKAPVRNISWSDAQQYVAWLRSITNRPYRLPTEAEWEYAARANTSTRYWWGDEVGFGNANCRNCGGDYDRKAPAAVGSYRPNPFGLHETSGGVWEWVGDCWNGSYAGAPGDGSARDKPDCRQRVLRGGSWRNDASYLRSTARFYYDATVRHVVNGFRVALPLN
jgi:formylglycine-generating enzyme required for sulfatase activity